MDRTVTQGMFGTIDRTAAAESHVGTVAPSTAEKYRNMGVKPAAEALGAVSHIGMLAPSPPAPAVAPPDAQPPAEPPPGERAPDHAFVPPMFVDGAQLWACFDAAHAEANGAACQGVEAGVAFCRQQGFSGVVPTGADGAPDLTLGAVRPENRVRAINGDACTANNCVVVAELHCAP